MTRLLEPLRLRSLDIPNRVWMSPMCMYSAAATGELAGQPTDFHLAHYGSRAAGGVGLAILEATAVTPEGRISPNDLGFWSDEQIPAYTRLADIIRANGAVPGIQLAHAGRKASTHPPFAGGGLCAPEDDGWTPVGPSAVPFPGLATPQQLSLEDIAGVVEAFTASARRSLTAGFEVAEIHAAHGYLLHEFLSPLSNHREDAYGGSFENRIRLLLEVIEAVRGVWPEDKPVLLRISTTDWVEENPDDDRESWTLAQSIRLAGIVGDLGIDLIDASSGGNDRVAIPAEVDYQTANAERLKSEAQIAVAGVGRITDPDQAESLLRDGGLDAVFLARALLADPSWANRAAVELGGEPRHIRQYGYALGRA